MRTAYFAHESSYIDEDVQIGEGTKIWHFCHIQRGAVIGENCSLGQNVNISNNVRVGEDYVFCGPSCVFTNDLTPRARYPKGAAKYKKTLVRTGASIGANATIICGHTIGEWAMIGAGAVVASDVPAHALMLGVPARRADWVCTCGMRLYGELRCAHCGRSFRKSEAGLEEISCSSET